MTNPTIILIDLFCGAGGVTTGFEAAKVDGRKIAHVAACVNHDEVAIQSHFANHGHVKHFTEDIRTLELTQLVKIINKQRLMYPEAKVMLWASLECTNFSKAKGGKPRNADSRTLAQHLYRYIFALNPDYVNIENVMEFMSWGPLDEAGKPQSRKNGVDYLHWVKTITHAGYNYDWRELNSADYGAYTSRKRFFAIFAKCGLPIAFPAATHAKKPQNKGMFGNLQKWKAVKDVLNLEDIGNSIFERKKQLSEKTLARIYAGLIKYIALGDDSFLAKYFSGNPEGKVIPTSGPAGTITCVEHQALVQVQLLDFYYGRSTPQTTEQPARTLRTKDCASLVTTQFIEKPFSSGSHNHSSVDAPAGTVMPSPKMNLVTAEPFVLNALFHNVGSSINSPAPTLTTVSHHYIVNPQWSINSGGDINKPCPVIIARQDKTPLYLVTTEGGEPAILIFEDDSEFTKKIKIFMAVHGIVDIKMRMLRVAELLKIQGFPDNYILKGTQAEQKKFIGNSVVPLVAQKIAEALAEKLLINNEIKAA